MLIDWQRLDTLIDPTDPDDQAWLKDMIQTLANNMVTRIENLNKLMESKDLAALKSELHQIKGVAANFGLAKMGDAVVRSEGFAKSGDLDNCIAEAQKVPGIWVETRVVLADKFKLQ